MLYPVKMLKKKTILVYTAIITLLLTSSVSVYAQNSLTGNADLLGLTEEEFDDYYEELLNEAEEDLHRPKWLVRTWGRSWELEPSTSEAAEAEACYRLSMRLIATRVYVTKHGYKLYMLEGSLTHDGESIKVYGAAILDKHGCFCMKLDSEEPLGFRLFGCGRIRTVHGVIRIRMKGRIELEGIHYGFVQRGFAKRIRLETASEIQ
jgi:hypothetical protein